MQLKVRGYRITLLYLGMNSINPRVWQVDKWENILVRIQEERKSVYSGIKLVNSTAFMIFSIVLPRPGDWTQTKQLCIAYNTFLKNFAHMKNCGYIRSNAPFIYKDKQSYGDPLTHLLCSVPRDGWLISHPAHSGWLGISGAICGQWSQIGD